MIGSALQFLTGQRSWIPLAAMAAMLLATCAGVYVQGLRLDAVRADAARQIQAEQVTHDATRARLAAATQEIVQLTAALEISLNATAALQDSLRDALGREAEAVSAAVARKAILDQIRTRARTEAETMEVVDDATRAAVTARLNRPL